MNFFKKTTQQILFSLTLLVTLGLPTQPAYAQANQQADAVFVEAPYVRQSPPGAYATASFMILHNDSNQDIYLIGAKSNLANIVELHAHSFKNGMMKMYQVPEIKIPANGSVALQPGGYHIMLIEPTSAMNDVKTTSLELLFKDGSSKLINLPVKQLKHKMH